MKRLFNRKKLLSKSFSEDYQIIINNSAIFKILKDAGYQTKLRKKNLFGFGDAATCAPDETITREEYVATKGPCRVEFVLTVDKIDRFHYKIKFKYNEQAKEFVEETLISQVVLKNQTRTNEIAIDSNDYLHYLQEERIFNKSVFVVGSVHGCYYTMLSLLKQFPKESIVIFMGDLCDIGNYSKEVIEYIIENNHSCVMGNHEGYFLKYHDKPESNWATQSGYGGAKTLASYANDPKSLKKHLEWIASLPAYIELNAENYAHFFISHGYGRPYYRRRNTTFADRALVNNRYFKDLHKQEYESLENNAITHIFSQDVTDDVLIIDNGEMQKDFGLNTSAAHGNKLSAIELNTLKIYTQKSDPRDIE